MATAATRVGALSSEEFGNRLAAGGVGIQLGPFLGHLRVRVKDVSDTLHRLYTHFPLADETASYSFHARLTQIHAFPRPHRFTVQFSVDGQRPHEDMPGEQAIAVLEWGINLVIALRFHCFLMLHCAVIERGGHALLMPAAPGFGKSTLCAALAHRGWRLLSDEFGLVRPVSHDLLPVPRPIALKNQSIEVIRRFAPDAVLGPVIAGTRKGDVAHVAPPRDSVDRQGIAAPARWIVFPKWDRGESLALDALPKSDAFMMLAMNAFNYELLGEAAFRTVGKLIDAADCYTLQYSDLDDAVERLTALADADVSG